MKSLFNFKIMTPEGIPIRCMISSLIIPSNEGFLGIQKNHAELVSILDSGLVSFKEKGEQWKHVFIETGSISVSKEEGLLIVKGLVFLDKLDLSEIQSKLKQLQINTSEDTSTISNIKSQNRIGLLKNILKSLQLVDSRKQTLGN